MALRNQFSAGRITRSHHIAHVASLANKPAPMMAPLLRSRLEAAACGPGSIPCRAFSTFSTFSSGSAHGTHETGLPHKANMPVLINPHRPSGHALPRSVLAAQAGVAHTASAAQPGVHHMAQLQALIQASLEDGLTRSAFLIYLQHTFNAAGLEPLRAALLANRVITVMMRKLPLTEVQNWVSETMLGTVVDQEKGILLKDEILKALASRADFVFDILRPYLHRLRNKQIVDVCAGDGSLAKLIYERVSPFVAGVDVAPRPRAGLEITLAQFDGERLDYPDASLDVVIANNLFTHQAHRQVRLDHIHRVLSPGAKLLVMETLHVQRTPGQVDADIRHSTQTGFGKRSFRAEIDIPVAGLYNTTSTWKRCFRSGGFSIDKEEFLGFQDPLLRDRHVMYQLTRRQN
ncbi:MAG: class I SAM-dependent methyltransferase [Janthinobacterium lividum]